MAKKSVVIGIVAVIVVAIMILSLIPENGGDENGKQTVDREGFIPQDAIKYTPEGDLYPPMLNVGGYQDPVPLEGPINTAGAEDSPFITPDGQDFYFFFTPDVEVPAGQQLMDGVTGIWHSEKSNDSWSEPESIILGGESLDGSVFVSDDEMWFGSVREGNYGEIDLYIAHYVDGEWTKVENAGQVLNSQYDIGEFHLTPDGNQIFFGWDQGEPANDRDLYTMERSDDGWSSPSPMESLNTDLNEDQPFLSTDGEELWFTGQSRLGHTGPSVYMSTWNGSGWGEPVEIISQFAGEPAVDDAGNIYFVHHYFDEELNILEADIYVAYADVGTEAQSEFSGQPSKSVIYGTVFAPMEATGAHLNSYFLVSARAPSLTQSLVADHSAINGTLKIPVDSLRTRSQSIFFEGSVTLSNSPAIKSSTAFSTVSPSTL